MPLFTPLTPMALTFWSLANFRLPYIQGMTANEPQDMGFVVATLVAFAPLWTTEVVTTKWGFTAKPARTGMKCPCYETAPDKIGLITRNIIPLAPPNVKDSGGACAAKPWQTCAYMAAPCANSMNGWR